jgi:threonine dehydrogenase-like Zn-dependent dehydrogenase
MEPLAVGVHSVSNLGGFRANQSIVIFGCGPVGLLCMAVAKAIGATRIIAVDIVPARLEFAKQYAATDTYVPIPSNEGESKIDYSKRNADAMRQQLGIEDRGSKAIDLVIDASGAEVSIQTAFHIVKSGGTFVQARITLFPPENSETHPQAGGHGEPERDDQPRDAHGRTRRTLSSNAPCLSRGQVKELNYKGSFRYGVPTFFHRDFFYILSELFLSLETTLLP